METEILNDILTFTVSKLFARPTDKKSSVKYESRLSGAAGSTAGSKMMAEMKSKYNNDEEEKKIEDDYKPG